MVSDRYYYILKIYIYSVSFRVLFSSSSSDVSWLWTRFWHFVPHPGIMCSLISRCMVAAAEEDKTNMDRNRYLPLSAETVIVWSYELRTWSWKVFMRRCALLWCFPLLRRSCPIQRYGAPAEQTSIGGSCHLCSKTNLTWSATSPTFHSSPAFVFT